jgi:hypothetical protein
MPNYKAIIFSKTLRYMLKKRVSHLYHQMANPFVDKIFNRRILKIPTQTQFRSQPATRSHFDCIGRFLI